MHPPSQPQLTLHTIIAPTPSTRAYPTLTCTCTEIDQLGLVGVVSSREIHNSTQTIFGDRIGRLCVRRFQRCHYRYKPTSVYAPNVSRVKKKKGEEVEEEEEEEEKKKKKKKKKRVGFKLNATSLSYLK